MSNEEKCCHEHEHEHEHHHDHDEECHCHDHEHEHHHDHDEECHCHDHEHEHHHDHDEECHCHDHEHHHEHEHVDEVSIVCHEEALAGSFSIDVEKKVAELDAVIKEAMNLLRVYIDFKEGVIGHIKAAITKDNEAVMYSLTLDEISVTGAITDNQAERVNFAAIVYGAEEDTLYELLNDIKEKLLH